MSTGLDKADHLLERELNLNEPVPAPIRDDTKQRRQRSIARLRLLWSGRRFLARSVAVGLAVAALVAFIIPNSYVSSTLLMPPDQDSQGGIAMLAALAGKAGGTFGSMGAQLLGLKTTGDLFIGILESRTVQDDLIQKFDLRGIYGDKHWEDARKDLAKETAISEDRKSGIITISVTDREPQRAQQMTEEYVRELNSVMTNLNTSSAHRERVFLEARLQQVQQNLESAERQFSQFASKNTAIDIQEQGKAMIEAGASLEGQLIAAQTELEGLRQIFTNNNIRVRETQARVDEIQRQIRKLGGTSSGRENDRINTSDNVNASLYPPIRQLPILGVTYADLYRQMKVQEAVFEALTQECELAKVEEAKETPSVKVLDPANIPEEKSSPHRMLIMLAGTFFACAFGVAGVLGRARWKAIDDQEPGKILAQQILRSVRGSMRWEVRNGSSDVLTPKKKEKAE